MRTKKVKTSLVNNIPAVVLKKAVPIANVQDENRTGRFKETVFVLFVYFSFCLCFVFFLNDLKNTQVAARN